MSQLSATLMCRYTLTQSPLGLIMKQLSLFFYVRPALLYSASCLWKRPIVWMCFSLVKTQIARHNILPHMYEGGVMSQFIRLMNPLWTRLQLRALRWNDIGSNFFTNVIIYGLNWHHQAYYATRKSTIGLINPPGGSLISVKRYLVLPAWPNPKNNNNSISGMTGH